MLTWLVVWIVLGAVSTVAVLAFVLALGRHVLILGRTARRFQAPSMAMIMSAYVLAG